MDMAEAATELAAVHSPREAADGEYRRKHSKLQLYFSEVCTTIFELQANKGVQGINFRLEMRISRYTLNACAGGVRRNASPHDELKIHRPAEFCNR